MKKRSPPCNFLSFAGDAFFSAGWGEAVVRLRHSLVSPRTEVAGPHEALRSPLHTDKTAAVPLSSGHQVGSGCSRSDIRESRLRSSLLAAPTRGRSGPGWISPTRDPAKRGKSPSDPALHQPRATHPSAPPRRQIQMVCQYAGSILPPNPESDSTSDPPAAPDLQ